MAKEIGAFLDAPPEAATLTAYDRDHIPLYLRLLDADHAGADWRDMAPLLFGLDPDVDPKRARAVCERHLARAKWMSAHGYRDLLKSADR